MIKFKPGDMIKHEAFMDVCLKVMTVYDYGHGYEIKAMWWNMAFVESFPMGFTTRLNIAKDVKDLKPSAGRRTHLKQWEILAPECTHDLCVRKSRWLKAG